MRIKQASAGDVPAIAALEARCFSDPWPEALIQRRLEQFITAGDNGELLGYLCLSSVLDEGSLDIIATAPEHRRQGVADTLLNAAEQKAREQALVFITLEVRASNTAAIHLYEKHGYRPVGLRAGYYQHPKEDAILMTRFL